MTEFLPQITQENSFPVPLEESCDKKDSGLMAKRWEVTKNTYMSSTTLCYLIENHLKIFLNKKKKHYW